MAIPSVADGRVAARPSWPVAFYRSTIGKKIIMGVTGLIGVGFVIAHMAGNLQVFLGREKMNAYAAMLHGPAAELVLIMRVVLVVALVLHVTMAVQLTQRARAARPEGYRRKDPQAATLASRTMRVGGVLLLAFIVFHILHFTTGTVRPAAFVPVRPYDNIVASFQIWWVTLFYVVAMMALGMHIFHGAWSSMRTLGVAQPSPQPLHRRVALLLAVVLWLGFTSVPLAVFFGLVR